MNQRQLTLALTLGLALTSAADAQLLGRDRARNRTRPTASAVPAAPAADATASSDPSVTRTVEVPPEPIPIEDLGKPSIALPDVPLEPYLLRKEHGPFMIMAHTFRGPEATQYALALALELQNQYKLPAYVFHLKIQPGGSNIRNVQPTATDDISNGEVGSPEKYRVFDEAAVLVGHAKTIDDAEKLLKVVKKIKPKTVDALPTIWGHRKGQGLFRAHITANPLQPAQNLYPGTNPKFANEAAGNPGSPIQQGQTFDPFVAASAFEQMKKPDPLVKRMNGGPRSLYKCPGPFSLQVAEYTGRATTDESNAMFNSDSFLKKSPLATAADDAEILAANLEKCRSLGGLKAYVYHDRFRSIVTIGDFSGPQDPALARLRKDIPLIVGEMFQRRFSQAPLVPATELTPIPRP